MQEDFQTERAFTVHRSAGKCPYTSGHIRPYHNMRSRTSIDPETFGSTSVGTSAGSEKFGGTYSPLDEQSFIRYKTNLRGRDTFTNTGVETFNHGGTFSANTPWRHPFVTSVIGKSSPSMLMNRPLNLSDNSNAFSNPINWT